jgi:phosphoribosylaminoimidazolecarboxamide formyltransferase/IMP cyclohydrolase
MTTRPVRRALLAVYDKTGVVAFAQALRAMDVTLVSSGGTAKALRDAGIDVTEVADVTGFPEMLGGRVKTLHPAIHAGLLADARDSEHLAQIAAHGIEPFDLVAVNLYPFRQTVAAGATFAETIEKIDIGGPAMVRAGAKNFESVAVVVDPARYDTIVDEMQLEGGITRATRAALAAEAFAHTAAYDAAVARWFAADQTDADAIPAFVGLAFEKVADLRYGENPHQRGAVFAEAAGAGVLGGAEVLQGKAMSFNNWLDASAAYDLALALPQHACVIVKHNNPCGAAALDDVASSYRAAFAGDEVSSFGGVVAFHGECDAAAAGAMRDVFTEVVIAPRFTSEALERFAERPNLRLVRAPLIQPTGWDVRTLPGGALIQDVDAVRETRHDWKVASERQPSEREWRDLEVAWTIAWRVKSNAVVLVNDRATVGIGAGQMSRVDSSWIASRKAGERAHGAVCASDAFFPFPDALDVVADAGCTAVVHPGGSRGDDDVLAAAEERGMAVVLTGVRHFRH